MWGIKINRFIALAVTFLIFILNSSPGIAAEVFVQPGGSINAAINNASSGDEIVVGSGNYTENIVITKDDLVIRSESGNPEDTVIMAGNSSIEVLHIRANNTTVSGFKIRAAEDADVTGIYLAGCTNCTIANNNISESYLGIYLSNCKNNTILDNSVNSNQRYGIQLVRSENNLLLNNTADSNNHGIVVENNCSNNNLTGNMANSNLDYGFYLINSSGNTLNNNTATGNNMGIHLRNSNMSVISGNNIFRNFNYGIWMSISNYSTISGNTVNKTNYGIHLDSSDNNIIYGNVIFSNYAFGLSMCGACDSNTIFNNYFNNNLNTDIKNRKNALNIKKTEGTNIVGGPYIAGNFWASPGGTGFSETAYDVDGNGLADVMYNETNVTDYLPLVSVSGLQQQILPVADLDINISITKFDPPIPDEVPTSAKNSTNSDEVTERIEK